MAQNNSKKDDRPQANTWGLRVPNWAAKLLLQVSYFEGMCSVNIHTSIEQSGQEYTTFEQKPAAVSYLKTEHAKAFYKKGKKAMERYEDSGEFKPFGVELKKSIIELSTAGDLKKKLKEFTVDIDDSIICLILYGNIDEVSKRAPIYMVYPFPSTTVVTSYDPETGERETELVQAEVSEFLDGLNDWSRAMGNGQVHASKNDSKYERRRFERLAFELAAHLGIDQGSPIKRGVGNSNTGGYGGGTKSNTHDNRTLNTGSGNNGSYTTTVAADDEDAEDIIARMRRAANDSAE